MKRVLPFCLFASFDHPTRGHGHMTDLTPEKIKELTALLADAPPETAARLLVMFERMKVKGSQIIPSSDLIHAMREAGMTQVQTSAGATVRLPTFERLFFEPFENLFENGPMDHMLPGSLPRAGLREVWLLVTGHFVPEDMGDLEPQGTAAILRGDIEQARALALQLRMALHANLSAFSNNAIAKLAKSVAAHAILQRLVPLLIAEAVGREIWANAFGSKGELSDQGVATLCANVRNLEDENAGAARELLLLTMVTLPRPSEAIRVLNKASYGVDDRRLDITEFAVIGRRILASASRAAEKIEEASLQGKFDGATLAATVERYNQNMTGMEREANLAVDGPWRREMMAIRKKVGNRLETICQRATHTLETALPVERTQRHGLRWTHEPKVQYPLDPARLEIAVQGLAFVAASRLFAPLAGYGAPRDAAAKHASAYLDNICEALLQMSRAPQKPENFGEWVHGTASLLEVFEGLKAAHLFERRAMLAAASAAA
jgi:hypothetical protein